MTLCTGQCPSGRVDGTALLSDAFAPIQAFSLLSWQGKVQPASSIVSVICVSLQSSSCAFKEVTVLCVHGCMCVCVVEE